MIDGSVVKPVEFDRFYAFWHRCNDMVLSWMLNSISSDIRDNVVYFGTAQEIWDDLSVRFSQGNVPRIFQLKRELTALFQGSMSITAYFTKMRTLMDELNALSLIPKCTCPQSNCSCGVTGKLETYEQINKLSQFLMGLNDVFTGIRGQLLMMKPLTTLSQAYSLLLQEETQRATSIGVVTDNIAMNVAFSGQRNMQFNPKKYDDSSAEICEYCHNPGHSQTKCFFLHGYPDWHRLHGKPKPKLRIGGSSVKKAAHVNSSLDVPVNDKPSGSDISTKNIFSDAQYKHIAKMIQNNVKNIGSSSWNSGHLSGRFFEPDDRDW
ncbi:uncharacterized protein LOC141661419 [Apium graveolens]|uniref:uncharacterized protein LOC141661419 n=1 Tax=Apium graveolens TaxID=4045 RepID=UPI003D7BB165